MDNDILIRSAVSADIVGLTQLDHDYSTNHVWQMGVRSSLDGVIDVNFREVRLPRVMRVTYPRNPDLLMDEWVQRMHVFVAEAGGDVCGYAALIKAPAPGAAWLTDLVVGLPRRRTGIGYRLLREAKIWCAAEGFSRLFTEVQSKNFPAISFFKKHGFSFSGYSDVYFPDQDIALLFVSDLIMSGKESSL